MHETKIKTTVISIFSTFICQPGPSPETIKKELFVDYCNKSTVRERSSTHWVTEIYREAPKTLATVYCWQSFGQILTDFHNSDH